MANRGCVGAVEKKKGGPTTVKVALFYVKLQYHGASVAVTVSHCKLIVLVPELLRICGLDIYINGNV